MRFLFVFSRVFYGFSMKNLWISGGVELWCPGDCGMFFEKHGK